MVEVVGDPVMPSELVLGNVDTRAVKAGLIGMSGGAIFWSDGTDWFELSGSNTGD